MRPRGDYGLAWELLRIVWEFAQGYLVIGGGSILLLAVVVVAGVATLVTLVGYFTPGNFGGGIFLLGVMAIFAVYGFVRLTTLLLPSPNWRDDLGRPESQWFSLEDLAPDDPYSAAWQDLRRRERRLKGALVSLYLGLPLFVYLLRSLGRRLSEEISFDLAVAFLLAALGTIAWAVVAGREESQFECPRCRTRWSVQDCCGSCGLWLWEPAIGTIGTLYPDLQDADSAAQLLPVLVEELASTSDVASWRAAWALGRLGPEAGGATEALALCLKHRDRATRVAAAVALGAVGPGAASAIPALEEARTEKDQALARNAEIALRAIRGESNVPPEP